MNSVIYDVEWVWNIGPLNRWVLWKMFKWQYLEKKHSKSTLSKICPPIKSRHCFKSKAQVKTYLGTFGPARSLPCFLLNCRFTCCLFWFKIFARKECFFRCLNYGACKKARNLALLCEYALQLNCLWGLNLFFFLSEKMKFHLSSHFELQPTLFPFIMCFWVKWNIYLN